MNASSVKKGYKQVNLGFRYMNIHIPNDWTLKSIDECCNILDSKRVPLNYHDRDLITGDIPYYGANGIQGHINKYIFDEELILLAEDGGNFSQFQKRPIAYRILGKSWVNNHAHVLNNKNFFDFNFIFYSLVHKNIIPWIKGSTRAKLNQNELKKIKIGIPKTEKEQEKIGSILSNIDRLIQKQEQEIEQIQKLKKGMMQKLLIKGISHTKFKNEEWIFQREIEVPAEWDVVSLKTIVASYLNGIYKPDRFYGRGHPSIRMFNIKNGFVNKKKCFLLEVTNEELEKFGLLPNDILINRVNSDILVGKCGIVPERFGSATFESKNIRIRVNNKKCDAKFLNYFFNSYLFYVQLKSFIQAAVGQTTINQDALNKVKVPIPRNIEEQQKISSILSNIDNLIHKESHYKEKLEKNKKGLMQKLLTGEKRVKI